MVNAAFGIAFSARDTYLQDAPQSLAVWFGVNDIIFIRYGGERGGKGTYMLYVFNVINTIIFNSRRIDGLTGMSLFSLVVAGYTNDHCR